jgi:hypothetical protein
MQAKHFVICQNRRNSPWDAGSFTCTVTLPDFGTDVSYSKFAAGELSGKIAMWSNWHKVNICQTPEDTATGCKDPSCQDIAWASLKK